MWEMWVWPLGRGDSLEKEMAAHSSILALEIPWTEEPGRLHSTGSEKSRKQLSNYNLATTAISNTECLSMCLLAIHVSLWRNTWSDPLPIFELTSLVSCWVTGVLSVFWLSIPYQICILQIFSCSVGCLFTLWVGSFDVWFNIFYEVQIFQFFWCLCLWCHLQETIAKPNVSVFILCLLLRILLF